MTCFDDIFVCGKLPPMIFQTRLENGLQVALESVLSSTIISLELFVPMGALTENQSGCSSLLEEWLRRGAAGRDAQGFEDAWDDLGALRGSEVGLEGMEFSVTCLAADAPKALELLADWVLRPNLAQADYAPSFELAHSALEGLEDAPDELLYAKLWKTAFASSHGTSPYGTRDGFLRLDAALVRADYARRCTPQGAVLAVAGALEWAGLLELVERFFGAWHGDGLPLPAVQWNPPSTVFEPRDTAQTQIGLIMPLMPFAGAGYYPSRFGLEVLGGGNSSRLFNEVREARGLVYGIHAGSSFMRGAGTLEIFASCTPSHTSETLSTIRAELERWRLGIAPDEFARAHIGIQTGLAMSLESIGARAAALQRDTVFLGAARGFLAVQTALQQTTLAQVNAWLELLDFSQVQTFILGADISL